MAKGFGRGANAITVGMIVFVALWLTSTVFLVILYTGQEQIVTENNRLREDNRKLISDAERRSVSLFEQARAGGPTVVGLLEGARSEMAKLATGDANSNVAAAQDKLNEILRAIQSDAALTDPQRFQGLSYHQALVLLYEAYNSQGTVRRDLEAKVAQILGEVARFAESSTQNGADFEKRARELAEQLKAVEAGRDRYHAERDKHVTELEKIYEDRRLLSDADLTRERQRVALLETQISQLRQRLQSLQEKFGDLLIGPEDLATARLPDGRILTAIAGDEVVYIDLGEKDRLVLGMTFAVYSPDTGIPVNGRSKAQIEVVSIGETSAECKILQQYGRNLILEGDWIANPVYDRSRPVRFVVAGDFDLDHDSVADGNGAEVLAARINKWGGTIEAEVTALTDFVVLGVPPRKPRPISEATPEETARMQALQRRFDSYQQAYETARNLTVPTMTQQVFLTFLGFGGAAL